MGDNEYARLRDLMPMQSDLASLREQVKALQESVHKLMTNDLSHVQAKLVSLETQVVELKESILPFIRGVNDTIKRFEEKDACFENAIGKLTDTAAANREMIRKNGTLLWKIAFVATCLAVVASFFSDEIVRRLVG